jgi:hypothetical protein
MNRITVLICAAGVLPLCAADKPTFADTIAPIVYRNCTTCHRPGQAAPFSLITYDDVKKRGSQIAAVTQSRYMPPWHAEHGYGVFADERRLSDDEIAAIASWVKQGMPQGDPKSIPAVPEFPEGWQLGKPDLILEMPAAFELPASGPDIYRNFVIPTRLTEDKWVRAIEFHPGARKVVHHTLFAYDAGGASARMDGRDGKPGFSGMSAVGVEGAAGNGGGRRGGLAPSNGFAQSGALAQTGSLGGWAVGATPAFFPEGVALPLPKGSDIILQMHFHLTGKPESERSTIGIYFAEKAPERLTQAIQVPALFGIGAGLDIKPGETFTVQDSMTLPVDVKAFSVSGHAHYLCKEMKATATLPDGATRPLLWIRDWDFNWQDRYTYQSPVVLPAGTRIDVKLVYDNSAGNVRNPRNPPQQVWWGEQSFDEMGSVTLMAQTVRKEDEPALRRVMQDKTRAALLRAVTDGTVVRIAQEQFASQESIRK